MVPLLALHSTDFCVPSTRDHSVRIFGRSALKDGGNLFRLYLVRGIFVWSICLVLLFGLHVCILGVFVWYSDTPATIGMGMTGIGMEVTDAVFFY